MPTRFRSLTTFCLVASLAFGLAAARGQVSLPGVQSNSTGHDPLADVPIKVSAYFTPPQSGYSTLYIVAEFAPGWHSYSLTQPPGGPLKTKIKLSPSTDYHTLGDFKPHPKPEVHEYKEIWPGLIVEEHSGRVTWSAPIEFTAGVDTANLNITGAVNAQICAKECLPPQDYRFTARQRQPSPNDPQGAAPGLRDSSQDTPSDAPTPAAALVASGGFDETQVSQNVESTSSLPVVLLSAFFGGMILNLMPCVFPIIGLKILSFVEQSHHDRRRLLVLNLWYSAGVVFVFIALALIAIALRSFLGLDFKYGSQNAIQGYAVGMAAIMFVMGLSMLGVWEIPIPGFLGSGKAGHLMQQEGFVGAAAKGALTTLLGASCSGPLVAVAFAFALDRGTPAWATIGTFAVIGFGMAAPYLILGMSPRLLRFLPKPGPWMDMFKHVCGFILLAAMVWVLSWMNPAYVVPTVAFLVGLWAACWIVGHVSLAAPLATRLQAWGWATAVAIAAGLFAFDWLAPTMVDRVAAHSVSETQLAWQPFSKELLKQLTRDRKTVMVDFTADWCLNCKFLEKTVLNTADVKSIIQRNGVVPLVADYTDAPPELTEMLTLLKAGAVPVLAIFPAGDPNKPIVFREPYSKQTLIAALEQAGPSASIAAVKELTIK